jgi:hypothetical protein
MLISRMPDTSGATKTLRFDMLASGTIHAPPATALPSESEMPEVNPRKCKMPPPESSRGSIRT